MYPILLYFSPKIFTRKRLYFYSHFINLSALCCAAQDAYLSSDDNVALDLSYIELQQRMQKHATAGSIINALNTLNCMRHGKPTVYDYNSMFYCYFKSKSVVLDELFVVYIKMIRFGPSPNLLTYNTLLNGLISIGSLKDAILIVKDMTNCGFSPSFTVISKLLRRLLKVGNMVDSATTVFEIMLSVNYIPSYYNVSAMFCGLCEVGRVQKAYFFFLALLEKKSFPGGYLFDHLLWALCKSEQSYPALAFFAWLKKKGITHTIGTYTALVYGYSKGRMWIEASNCLNEMENDDCKPHRKTYTIIIKFLCDNGKVDEALKYMYKMEKEGCVPDLVTYNIVLRELCHQGRVVDAGELLRSIDQKGFVPDLYTFSALTGGMLKSGKVEIANKLLVDVVRECSTDDVIYNICLHSICCHGSSGGTLSLMESMEEEGFRPTTVAYNTILKGLCKENNLDEALELLDHANWPTNGPDLISFSTILSAACKQRNSSMIQRVVNRMEVEEIKLDVVSSTCLIQYFCTIGKIFEGLKLLESMVNNGPRPNTVTLNTLLIGLCKDRLLGMAENIFNYFKSIGISPDRATYNILMRASVREDNDLLLDKLSRDMRSQNLKPDASTYGAFIYSLCRGGKISLALQLRDQLLENGISANIFIYNTIMEAMFKKGMFWQIILLLKEMAMYGCEPNEVSFGIFKRASRNGWMRNYPRALKIIELVMCGNLDCMNERPQGEIM